MELERLKSLLAGEKELLGRVLAMAADYEELVRRLEKELEFQRRARQELAQKEMTIETLKREMRELRLSRLTRSEGGGDSVPSPADAGGEPAAAQDERIQELLALNRELEEELRIRDEVISGLRSDFNRLQEELASLEELKREKLELKEQLALALSQLEMVADGKKAREALSRLSAEADELRSRVELLEQEKRSLLAKLAEASEASGAVEDRKQDTDEEEERPSHFTALLIGIMGLVLGFGLGWYSTHRTPAVRMRPPGKGTQGAEAHLSAMARGVRGLRDLAALSLHYDSVPLAPLIEREAASTGVRSGVLKEWLSGEAAGVSTPAGFPSALPYETDVLRRLCVMRGEGALRADQKSVLRYVAARELYLLGRQAFLCGEVAAAEGWLKSARALSPATDPLVCTALADIANLEERLDEAFLLYKEAIAADPEDAKAHAGLGGIYMLKGSFLLARQELEEAVRLLPSLKEALYNLGLVCMRMEDWPEAERAFTRLLEIAPEHAAAHYQLSRVYMATGRPEAAEEELERARCRGYVVKLQQGVSGAATPVTSSQGTSVDTSSSRAAEGSTKGDGE